MHREEGVPSFSLSSKVYAPCRLIWPASISPERLLRAGSEPIYPRATLTKTVGAVQTRTWLGITFAELPRVLHNQARAIDNCSKCAWYHVYTRIRSVENGRWTRIQSLPSLPRSIVTESSYPRAISLYSNWSGGRMDRWRVASDGLIHRVKNCSINTLSPVMSTSGC